MALPEPWGAGGSGPAFHSQPNGGTDTSKAKQIRQCSGENRGHRLQKGVTRTDGEVTAEPTARAGIRCLAVTGLDGKLTGTCFYVGCVCAQRHLIPSSVWSVRNDTS